MERRLPSCLQWPPAGEYEIALSTLKAYFDAVGAEATITIRVGEVEHRASLAELL
ncbi:MAG: hypothetical protein FWE61_09275 [Micrococcales bacterium]|nr:hypothetical protein [Micrococcales bacterium]